MFKAFFPSLAAGLCVSGITHGHGAAAGITFVGCWILFTWGYRRVKRNEERAAIAAAERARKQQEERDRIEWVTRIRTEGAIREEWSA